MKDELAHSMEALKKQPVPPYFLGYQITEGQSMNMVSSFGALLSSNESRRRILDIDLRVGDYAFDNTHALRGAGGGERASTSTQVPLENDPQAIRELLWLQTDLRYKRTLEMLARVKANAQVRAEQEDKSSDFSSEQAEKYTEKPAPLRLDRKVWEEKIRKYSEPFRRQTDVTEARASFTASVETRWLVNSEGTEVETGETVYQISVSASARAEDGTTLPRFETFSANSPEGLPDDAAILKTVDRMIADLGALRHAPVIDPYTGPALLSGRAAGVFFHEVFGHRIEGHRQKIETEGQTFKKQVKQPVLPATFSVYSDPTQRRQGNIDLLGAYRYDDEGVKARRVTVVENGVLQNFLMSRSPIDGFPQSNGHGRKQAGFPVVARQSNLIVQAAKTVPRAQLKKMLLEEVAKAGKPYGLLFDDIQGGFTLTGRSVPNAFNVMPIMVYRVFPDGREELVRGVDLIGTPLNAFSSILAADDQPAVFNGICGAESGSVPVSTVAPGLLLAQVEVQKKPAGRERPPLLPPPPPKGGSDDRK